MDDGFAYAVPDGLTLQVGDLVRVPLGGRRVRGWVVATCEPERPGLRAVVGRSGDLPVFDRDLLGVLRWTAAHYVAPLAAVLAKATPPNLPRGGAPAPSPRGARSRPVVFVGPGPWGPKVAELVAPAQAAGRSALVVAPTVGEAEEVTAAIPGAVGPVSSQAPATAVTRAWVAAATRPGSAIVGTREVAAWPLAAPGIAVVVGEDRKSVV